MPGTYRYSATFDRTYEEPDQNAVRFSIQSWQGSTSSRGEDEEDRTSHVRSPSTDSLASCSSGGSGHSRQVSGEGQELGVRHSKSGKQMTSPMHNPLQFVKVGPVPLYKKAEEQIKLLQEVKQTKTKATEDEEWQMNLDKWKSRRKKVSEKTIQRVEERRQIESAVESQTTSQRKIKTFSEMLEERSHKPRAYNLAIYKDDTENSSLEENKTNGYSVKSIDSELPQSSKMSNGSGDQDDEETGVGDSGLESFGSSQRTYDIPDSSSEISGGSLDRLGAEDDTSNEGITTGMDMLEEFSSPTSFSSSRDLNEEQPVTSVDLKSLERFFKSSDSEKASVEELSNGDAVTGRDYHSIEKPKRTPPPVPVKPKLLRASSNPKTDYPMLVAEHAISKTVKPVTRTEKGIVAGRAELASCHRQTKVEDQVPCDELRILAEPEPKCRVTRIPSDPSAIDIAVMFERLDVSDSETNQCTDEIVCEKTLLLEDVAPSDEECLKINDKNSEYGAISNDIDVTFEEEMEREICAETDLQGKKLMQCVEIALDTLEQDKLDATVVEEQIVKVQAKSKPSHFAPLTPVVRDDGLTVIYQSHPQPSSVTSSSVTPESQRPEERKSPSSLDKVVLNNIIDELEDAIKFEMESEEASAISAPTTKEEMTVPKKEEADIYNLTLDLYTDEELLANLDAPPSQMEPPKERPPPPPTVECPSSSPEKNFLQGQTSNGVQRMNTFKRIKKELWRRRSDFLGIDPSEGVVDVDAVPPPPDLQEMLKSEREIDRQWMEQNRPVMVPEDEIVQKEREIIENLEREERERQEGEKDEQELMLEQGKETGSPKQEDEERIRRLKDERRRMEEERFQREEQRMRLEEERLLREREEQMKKQEDACQQEALRLEREGLQQEREAFQREKEEYNRRMESEQRRLSSNVQKAVTPTDALPGREALVSASKCPQGFTAIADATETLLQNGVFVQEKNQMQVEQPPTNQQQPVLMRNRLQSLGAAPKAKYIKNEQWINDQHDKASKRRSDPTLSRYNQNHWLIQEAEMRRLTEQSERQRAVQSDYVHSVNASDCSKPPKVGPVPPPKPPHVPLGYPVEQQWNYRTTGPIPWRDPRKSDMVPATGVSRPQDHFLSVSGKEKCSHCGQHLGRGEAMIIESLQLCYHLQCFTCCVCRAQLGNGSCGTDVRVRNNKLHCQNCYSNDEAGLKFSQV